MKREDKIRDKELKNNFKMVFKECAKIYKINKRDYLLWTSNENNIFEIFPRVFIREIDLKPIMDIECSFKPFYADDILWEILDMESNKKEPKSLRVIGAFTAPSKQIYNNLVILDAIDIETVKSKFYEELDKILELIKTIDESDYTFKTGDVGFKKATIIRAIHNEEYETARKILNEITGNFSFIVGNKSFEELAIKYINKKDKKSRKLRWIKKKN